MSRQVNAKILGKDYCLSCEDHEQEDLIKAVELLNQRIREFREHSQVVGSDRIAVMAAVHLAYDILLEQRRRNGVTTQMNEGIHRLSARIAGALAAEPDQRT